MWADVVEYVESEKLCQPSMYTSELQRHLLLDRISPLGHLPSQSAMKKCIQKDCRMTNEIFPKYSKNHCPKQIWSTPIIFLTKLANVTI